MFGKRLRECRLELGLTQAELAKELSLTQSTIGKFEREEREPSISLLIKFCKRFDVSADFLLGLEDDVGVKSTK